MLLLLAMSMLKNSGSGPRSKFPNPKFANKRDGKKFEIKNDYCHKAGAPHVQTVINTCVCVTFEFNLIFNNVFFMSNHRKHGQNCKKNCSITR